MSTNRSELGNPSSHPFVESLMGFEPRQAGHSDAPSRSDATVEAIEQYILREQLKSGDPLPSEASLCEVLGVSRSSVREALRQLQALEIVRVHQGRGAFVGDMSLRPFVRTLMLRSSLRRDQVASLREVVATRKILDLGLARDVVIVFPGKRHPELHEIVDRMLEKAGRGEVFFEEDIAFHKGMLRELNNTLVEELTNAMWLIHMAAVPQLPSAGSEAMMQTAHSHREMLATAEAGDALGYLTAVEKHYAPLETSIAVIDRT